MEINLSDSLVNQKVHDLPVTSYCKSNPIEHSISVPLSITTLHGVNVQLETGGHNSPSYLDSLENILHAHTVCSLNCRCSLIYKTIYMQTLSLYYIKAKLNKRVPYASLSNKCQGVEGIMLTYSSIVLCAKLKELSTDVTAATSEILGIDILLQPFLIILGVSQNQSRLQRAKGQLLSYIRITERK